MPVSRVTSQSQWASLTADLAAAAARSSAAQQQIATGKKLNKVSDGPTDSATVLRIDQQSSALAAYAKQASDANNWLATADTALQDVSNLLSNALGTTKAALNGSLDQTGRDALAEQLDALRDQLFDVASTTVLGRPIFGGFGTAAVAKDPAGTITYTGVPGQVNRQVAPNVTVAVNVDGSAAFGFASGDDVFKVLSDAAAAARAGDTTGLQSALTRLGDRQNDALAALHKVGTTQNSVDAASSRGDSMKLALDSARSDLVNVDIPKAVMDMQLAQDGYNAVLGAISRVSNMPSLATLLR